VITCVWLALGVGRLEMIPDRHVVTHLDGLEVCTVVLGCETYVLAVA
jgi:hypothetical protein